MTDTEIKATVRREQRTDRAERTLTVENAPEMSYETRVSYRDRRMKTVTWRPTDVRITWDQGVLWSVHVSGFKLKKDGTEGALRGGAYFPIKDGLLAPGRQTGADYDRRTEPPTWLSSLVAAHAEVPPFKALTEVGA